jgi:hypothetical protein
MVVAPFLLCGRTVGLVVRIGCPWALPLLACVTTDELGELDRGAKEGPVAGS